MLKHIREVHSYYICHCGYGTKPTKNRLKGKMLMMWHGLIKHRYLNLDVILYG